MAEQSKKSRIGAWVGIIFAIIYGASPVDLISDVVPLFGWGDDAVVVILAIVNLVRTYRKKEIKG